MKKLFTILFIFTFSFSLFSIKKKVKATLDTTPLLTLPGAMIRTIGYEAIRFVGVVSDDFDLENVSKIGMIVGYGEVTDTEFDITSRPNGQALGRYEIDAISIESFDHNNDGIDEKCVMFIIYNIPESNYSSYLSARLYAKYYNDTYIYSEDIIARSVNSVALDMYNDKNVTEVPELIKRIVSNIK